MADLIELQEVDDFVPKTVNAIKFPCVVIDGITTEEEVLYFNSKFSDMDKSLPLYVLFNGEYKKIGYFELTLDNILVVRSIDKYVIKLARSIDNQVKIDIENPESLINFIVLSGR